MIVQPRLSLCRAQEPSVFCSAAQNLERVSGSDAVSLATRPCMLLIHHFRARKCFKLSRLQAETVCSRALHIRSHGCTFQRWVIELSLIISFFKHYVFRPFPPFIIEKATIKLISTITEFWHLFSFSLKYIYTTKISTVAFSKKKCDFGAPTYRLMCFVSNA